MKKTIILIASLILTSGCTPAIFSHHELLPNSSYLSREPIEIKSIYDRKRAGEITAKDRTQLKAKTKVLIDQKDIVVYKDGLKPKSGAIYFAQIAAWSQAGAPIELLNRKLIDEAKKLGADLVVLLDKGSEVSGQSTVFSNDLGFAITQNQYTIYRKAVAGMRATASAGFITDQSGVINYIYQNSPAENAGLKEGYKILSINDSYFLQDPFVVDREIRIKSPGETVKIEFLDRSGEKKSCSLTLNKPVNG